MSEKHFTRREAEELLPKIEAWLKQARTQKEELNGLSIEAVRAATRIMILGGSLPSYRDLANQKLRRDQLVAQLQQMVAKIQETGCVVKDPGEGLVDFPSLLEGEEVYLCWKLGEGRILYWHGIHEGFAERKPLDDSTPDEPPHRPRI